MTHNSGTLLPHTITLWKVMSPAKQGRQGQADTPHPGAADEVWGDPRVKSYPALQHKSVGRNVSSQLFGLFFYNIKSLLTYQMIAVFVLINLIFSN